MGQSITGATGVSMKLILTATSILAVPALLAVVQMERFRGVLDGVAGDVTEIKDTLRENGKADAEFRGQLHAFELRLQAVELGG